MTEDLSNMKFIHWEYNPEFYSITDSGKADMTIGAMRNRDTDKPTGFWFKWTYLIESGNNVWLHCVCEDSYTVQDFPNATILDMVYMRNKSFENFKRMFKERMDIIGVAYPPPKYLDDIAGLQKVLTLIQSEF